MTSAPPPEMQIALLTAGKDRPYAFGMATALRALGVRLDLIVGDELDIDEFRNDPGIRLLVLRRESPPGSSFVAKVRAIVSYYLRLVRYAWSSEPRVFHILWNNKFETIDRVVLMLYYRLLGKRVVLTAHNVNTATRDGTDTLFNRLTLKFQYRLCDQIFVHTEMMKTALTTDYSVPSQAVTVIPFGINNSVPNTTLSSSEARERLGIAQERKTILFFGNIAPYKGLEYLVAAFRELAPASGPYHLIVAGRPKGGFEDYWESVRQTIGDDLSHITLKIEFVDDRDTEVYFKAADVLALPYTSIFQSGVLFLGYSFGLPVVAADVGSLREEIVDGETGLVFAPQSSTELKRAIETYFSSELYRNLPDRRSKIQQFANEKYSWEPVAKIIRSVYGLLRGAFNPRVSSSQSTLASPRQ